MRRVGFFSGVSTFPSVPLSDGGDRGVAGFLELGDRALAAAQVATLITRKRIDYLYSWIEINVLTRLEKKKTASSSNSLTVPTDTASDHQHTKPISPAKCS